VWGDGGDQNISSMCYTYYTHVTTRSQAFARIADRTASQQTIVIVAK